MDVLTASPALAIGGALVLGLLVGSFLNVVILRLPPRLEWQWRRDCREMLELPAVDEPQPPDLVFRRSHDPATGAPLAWWENIPLLSWALLRGRSRHSGERISLQYPAVELLTGVLFAVCVWQFGATVQGLAALVFTALLVAMSGIDLRTTLLPDQLTYPLLWLGLLAAAFGVYGVTPTQAILGATIGYLALWSVYWGFKLLTGKEGMGYGDFKLLAALGAWCGAIGILPIVLLSAVAGAVIGSAWLAIKGRDRATPIPFGPYLAIAGWVQFVFGDRILAAYFAPFVT
ncbi:prepilin peptidase [Coralloluteibacterium thermophilus]|uniref:Prepilin leader peptidase/N-methyltransferase n=1 Tax=Coralloluteibacterium thermophilum TaxID=2707049 RepID=A0ABV9NQN2_9GAMM